MTNLQTGLVRGAFVLAFSIAMLGNAPLRAQTGETAPPPSAALSVDQIVERLQQRNQERASALRQFQGTRIYRMQYRGVPGDKDAEMVVIMSYQSPASKEFTVVSQTGSKFILDHVFTKLLEGEQEAAKEDNRQRTALNSENYQFQSAGYETTPEGESYVLNVLPKTKSKFLYVGKIWVDSKDFAVTRIEAEPAKNPSFWIKKSEIKHRYVKVNDFWLPAENRSESQIRLGGRAILSIEYKDYKIIQSLPSAAVISEKSEPVRAASF